MSNLIETFNLTKKFRDFVAVDNINISIPKGEIFGFLGPNGSGKTTTIKMLSTLLHPTSGKANVCGYDITKNHNNVRKSIGIVFQDPAVDDQLTGEENLDFHARMYGMKSKEKKERISYVLNLVDLKDKAKILVKKYSGGMRRRLEIARGLMHFPKVLFLDEPTLGLDPQTRIHIWKYIKKLNKEDGVTIFLTTHYMEEADSLCDRIGIIDKGKILVIDKPNNLKKMIGKDIIRMVSKDSSKLSDLLKRNEITNNVKLHDSIIDIGVNKGEEKIPIIMKIADRNNIEIKSISLSKPTLEDVFLQYTGKTIREEEASSKDHMRLMSKMWSKK